MTLKEKLERLKTREEEWSTSEWEKYKKGWIAAVHQLQNTICYKWFQEYEDDGLMEFNFVPTKRMDPYMGEYMTKRLVITLTSNKDLVLEPISAITTEYDGKMEFYLRGDLQNRVPLLRTVKDNGESEWLMATSSDPAHLHPIDKPLLEKVIDRWLA